MDYHSKSAVAIIQARMSSSRLPKKATKLLGDKPILVHIIERAFLMRHIKHVVVATGNRHDNREIISLAQNAGAVPFCGSDSNVLERFVEASHLFDCDFIVRITGDNPFTDVDYGSAAVEYAFETGADLSSVTGIPLGTAVELIKKSALEETYRKAYAPHHFEHVTPYIKENPDDFNIMRKPVHINIIKPAPRLTIDTQSDLDFATILFNALYNGSHFSVEDVLHYLSFRKDLLLINNNVTQRPMTHCQSQDNEIHSAHIV